MSQLTGVPPAGVATGKSAAKGPAHGVVRFSTAGLPEPRRVELWENHNARSLIGLGCRTLSEAALEATELNLQLPRIQFAHVAGNPHVVERTQSYISANPADAVVVYFNLDGEAFFYHRDGCEMLRPGQAVLYDADQPFMRGFSHGLRELALKIPRPVYKEISGRSSLGRPQIFDFRRSVAAGQHANALAGLMKSALADPEPDGAGLEASALDLFRILVNGDGGGIGHFAAAKSFILQRLRDPQLSAPLVAAAIGISDRQLSRVFAQKGISVVRFIREERLQLARRLLADPGNPRQPLARLAAELGFSSQSHFSRAYKELFGVSPLQARRAAP